MVQWREKTINKYQKMGMKIGIDVNQTAEEKADCGFVADQLIRSLVKNV